MAEEEYAGGKNRRECSEDSLKLLCAVDLLRKKIECSDRCWANSGPSFLLNECGSSPLLVEVMWGRWPNVFRA